MNERLSGALTVIRRLRFIENQYTKVYVFVLNNVHVDATNECVIKNIFTAKPL